MPDFPTSSESQKEVKSKPNDSPPHFCLSGGSCERLGAASTGRRSGGSHISDPAQNLSGNRYVIFLGRFRWSAPFPESFGRNLFPLDPRVLGRPLVMSSPADSCWSCPSVATAHIEGSPRHVFSHKSLLVGKATNQSLTMASTYP